MNVVFNGSSKDVINTYNFSVDNYRIRIKTINNIVDTMIVSYSMRGQLMPCLYLNYDRNVPFSHFDTMKVRMYDEGIRLSNSFDCMIFIKELDFSMFYAKYNQFLFKDGILLSNRVVIDYITAKNNLRIVNNVSDLYLKLVDCKEISNLQIKDIPYYNREGNETNTLEFSMTLSDVDYRAIYDKISPNHLSSEFKEEMFKFICEKYKIEY